MENNTEKITVAVPEWGNKTCVLGTIWKEGEYNGHKFAYTELHGISKKTINEGKDEVIVCEVFKIRNKRIQADVGTVVSITFDRHGNVEEIEEVEEIT